MFRIALHDDNRAYLGTVVRNFRVASRRRISSSLRAAIEAKVDVLLTGDKDFLESIQWRCWRLKHNFQFRCVLLVPSTRAGRCRDERIRI